MGAVGAVLPCGLHEPGIIYRSAVSSEQQSCSAAQAGPVRAAGAAVWHPPGGAEAGGGGSADLPGPQDKGLFAGAVPGAGRAV